MPSLFSVNTIELFILFLLTTLCLLMALPLLKATIFRISGFFIVGSIFLYNGIGSTYEGIPEFYGVYYLLFLLSFLIGFVFFANIKILSWNKEIKINNYLSPKSRERISIFILSAYFLLLFFGLVYPEFKLYQFFQPPKSNLTAHFKMRSEGVTVSAMEAIVNYLIILLTPFYYISLYRFRANLVKLLFFLLLPIYIYYVDNAYISRGQIAMPFCMLFIFLWIERPWLRRKLFYFTCISLPVLVWLAYLYQYSRLGATAASIDFLSMIDVILGGEVSFPFNVGRHIYEGDIRADVFEYIKWIVTLPIPKMLTGSLSDFRINDIISTYILGTSRGDRGFYIVLPGLIGESIFLFGKSFFWLHGLFLGLVSSFVLKLLVYIRSSVFLQTYFIFLITYQLNRGGVAGFLPIIVNQFILFYIVLFIVIFSKSKYIIKT